MRPVCASLKTGGIGSYQSFGDFMRWNPHVKCIVLEGGIDEAGSFYYILMREERGEVEYGRPY